METREPTDKSSKITRRQLLGAAAVIVGGSAGLVAASNLLFGQTDSQPQKLPSRRVREGKEEAAEQKPEIESLTFERAKELVPSIANLFISSINSQQTSQDIVDHSFIVRESESWKEILNIPDESIHELPAIQNLGRDYPELVLDSELARDLAGMYPFIGFVSAPDSGRNIFINLIMFSSHNLPTHFKGIEYDAISGEVKCNTIDAETAFRSVLLHEMTHRESRETLILESDVAAAYKKLYGDKIKLTEKRGFALLGKEGDKGGKDRRLPGFDELVAEYISARICTRNGLEYSSTYARPVDLYNFQLMLKKAKISDQELLDMYRDSKLREFLVRIGFAAKEGISEQEALGLGLDLSFKMNANERWPVPWKEVKVFFPEIDTQPYKYSELDFIFSPVQGGCVL